jgi:RNA polymerase sigma factor (sigma-70 family)
MGMAVQTLASPSATKQTVGSYYEARTFCELYNEFFSRINSYLRSRVRNRWDADDLTTVVFMKAWEKFEQYSRTYPFASWIFRIAHNTYVDYMRKYKEVPVDQEEMLGGETDETWQPELHALTNEELSLLHDRLDLLSRSQKDVLTLRYFTGLKISQVAEVLGKTESSIKMISHRGLLRLRRMYGRLGTPEIK